MLNLTHRERSLNSPIGGKKKQNGKLIILIITVPFNLVHKYAKKTFHQQEIDLEQFTDEELHSRFRLSLELIKYMVEILKEDL